VQTSVDTLCSTLVHCVPGISVLTLKGAAMTWFKGLEDNSMDSWEELNKAFSSHFTAQKRQPKTMASLSNILQGKDESLRDSIERFTREAIEVKGTNGKLKCYIFENGLMHDTKFKEKMGLKEPKYMQDLLSRAQCYINYEEKMLEERVEKNKNPPKGERKDKEDRRRKTPRGNYIDYTSLNASRETLLQEWANAEFAEAEIRPPREIRENPRTDTTKLCRFHRSAGHD
ncbi:hypothetical protein A2U01_0037726, partial [Trifolium medium]|nr:hypothetical protein [Trifolium medium]